MHIDIFDDMHQNERKYHEAQHLQDHSLRSTGHKTLITAVVLHDI